MTRRRGFTLLELIIATAMVAMLTLALYTGLVTAFRAQALASRQGDATRQAKAALDLIEQDLRSILPPKDGGLAGPFLGQDVGVGGDAGIIDFYTLGSDYGRTDTPLGDGFRHVKYALLADGTITTAGKPANMLVRGVVRAVANTAEGDPENETLARNVAELTVRYYDGAAWYDTWDSTQQSNGLPLAVELTIAIGDPTTADPQHAYKLTRMIRLSCGLTPDQATAVAAAAAADAASGTGTTTDADGTGGGVKPTDTQNPRRGGNGDGNGRPNGGGGRNGGGNGGGGPGGAGGGGRGGGGGNGNGGNGGGGNGGGGGGRGGGR